MDIQYFGANCVRISNKKATIVIDDNLKKYGKKTIAKKDDIVLYSSFQDDSPHTINGAVLMIDSPGEFEVSDTSIHGIPAQAHMDKEGTKKATIFKITLDDIRIVSLGHIYPDLSEEQLEAIGTIDILIVPVGGNGYTIDPIGAAKMVKKIDPKIIIPVHYQAKGFDYEVPQQPLEEALKVLSMEPAETTDKFKIKSASNLPEVKQLIVLEPQS